MSRVAIIGSCITRDLWPILGAAPNDLLYISRTSLASLMSPPPRGVKLRKTKPETLTRHQHMAVVNDVSKRALGFIAAHRPTHVIFDFIDERFDLLNLDGALVTHSWELETGGYLADRAFSRARPMPRLSDPTRALWLDAARELAGFLASSPLADARLILHEARWADRWRDRQGELHLFDPDMRIWEGRPARLEAHNGLLAEIEDEFAALAPGLLRVSAPKERVASEAHRWGLTPFHYGDDYYRRIWSQLAELGV